MTRTFKRLIAVLALAAIPLGPGIVAAPHASAGMVGCGIHRIDSIVHSECLGETMGGYEYIQSWVKCGTSSIWSKGNRIGPHSYVNHVQQHSYYDCWPWQPRVWTMAYWVLGANGATVLHVELVKWR